METVTKDTPDPALSTIGEHYVVDRELGRGGMATVYLCTDSRDGSRAAVKVLRHELGSAVVIERFLREIAYSSELDHPRIPKVLESGIVGDLPYYAMTYIEGESLRARLEREKQLDIDDAVRIACEAISATSYAHKRGIVHRDIKPDNILLGESGVFVLDFGIARAIVESGGDRLTSTGIGVGTPAYMSPEQALGDRTLDARSDIYSLGCVLYEMIAGIPPFVGPTAQVIISRRFAANAPPLRELREGVPNWLEQAVARALSKAPTDRWKTADDFSKALTAPGRSREISGARASLWRRPITRIAVAVVALAVFAGGLVAWSMGRRGSVANAEAAVRAWDFPTAEAELQRVVNANAADPAPQVALAQLSMLKGEPAIQWKSYVLYAADHRSQLSAADQMRVVALGALAAGRFGDACPKFEETAQLDRSRDAGDYRSTLALADCLRQDPGVVAYKASPSGYRFRASYQRIDSIYESLLDRHSGNAAAYAVLMPRLERTLSFDKRKLRSGVLSGSTPTNFYAAASLVADTMAYVPYAYTPATGPWRTLDPPERVAAASARNGQRLRALAVQWILKARDDPDGHEALARILEMTGELSGSDISAIQQIGIARSLAARAGHPTGPAYVRRLRLATSQVRLYIRLTQFNWASALADTVLGWPREAPADSATADDSVSLMLRNVAALRGQPSRVAEIAERAALHDVARLPTGEVVPLQPALGRDDIALSRYAEFGGPGDSVLTIAARLATNVNALVPAGQADVLRKAILKDPLRRAAPVIGPEHVAELGPDPDLYIGALAAAARGDRKLARTLLDSLTKFRSPNAPSEITMDVVYGEAWLRAALGDTVGATRQLENALRGLPAAPSSALRRPELTPFLVRVMALRAVLASNAKQPDIAKHWANAVFDLWGKGDPIVATTLEDVRRLR